MIALVTSQTHVIACTDCVTRKETDGALQRLGVFLVFVIEITTVYHYKVILNNNKRGKSSSKAQVAAYLLAILAMAERGGFKPPLLRGR
jgi:hypothetical protein